MNTEIFNFSFRRFFLENVYVTFELRIFKEYRKINLFLFCKYLIEQLCNRDLNAIFSNSLSLG